MGGLIYTVCSQRVADGMEGVQVSKRMSNLAFNQEFPAASGLSGIPRKNQVRIAHDRQNPYDGDAVGIWLEDYPAVPLGWLYRKDANRLDVLKKLESIESLYGHIELVKRPGNKAPRNVVVFWL